MQEGRWGAVCSDAWGLEEATVACRMLGFELSFQAMQMPAPADSPVFLSSVRCSGTESSLLDCAARRWEAGNCSADDSVGVSCLAAGISDSSATTSSWCAPRSTQSPLKTYATVSTSPPRWSGKP